MNAWSDDATPLLAIAEAAAFLNVGKATIRRWTDEGRLSCSRIGARGERRFRKVDLVDFVNESRTKSGTNTKSQLVFPVAERTGSSHHCIISDDVDAEWEVLGKAILAALDQGAQVFVIEVSDRKKRLESLLKKHGLNKRRLLESHALNCVSIEDSYLLSGEFHWDRAVAFVESAILTAKARGFERVLIVGADAGTSQAENHRYGDELKKYELALDAMLMRHPNASVLCPYTASVLSSQLMVQGFLTHPHLHIRDTSLPGLLGQVPG